MPFSFEDLGFPAWPTWGLPGSLSSGAGGLPKLYESPVMFVSSVITSAGCPPAVSRGRKLLSAPNTSSLKTQRVCTGCSPAWVFGGRTVPAALFTLLSSTDTPHPGNHHEHLGAITLAGLQRECGSPAAHAHCSSHCPGAPGRSGTMAPWGS